MKAVLFTLAPILFFACSSQDSSRVLDEGGMELEPAVLTVFSKIKSVCNSIDRKNKANKTYSPQECYLLLAGVTNKESSWNEKAPCDYTYGSPPVCGLTQSRQTDADALKLGCNVASDSTCNLKTGWLNIIKYGSNFNEGVDKHLGSNTGAKVSYVAAMKKVYDRADVRKAFGITTQMTDFNTVFYK